MMQAILIRAVSRKPVLAALLGFYTGIVGGWYLDCWPLPFALLAVIAARKTMNAYDDMRMAVDEALLVEAEANGFNNLPPPCKPYSGVTLRLFLAVIALRVTSDVLPQSPDDFTTWGLRGIWWLSLGYLLGECVALARWLYRRRRQRKEVAPAAPPVEDWVTWALDVPERSPTRAEAESQLPDYCARLISGSRGTEII
jgi:hypothetical protein